MFLLGENSLLNSWYEFNPFCIPFSRMLELLFAKKSFQTDKQIFHSEFSLGTGQVRERCWVTQEDTTKKKHLAQLPPAAECKMSVHSHLIEG